MSKEFIEQRVGSSSIHEACRQQKELAYFTQSSIQQPITEEYLKQYIERNLKGSDSFLNWVKTIFGTNNFLSFYKYLRFPVPSAKVVNNKIKPQLERVFHAEDSVFKYTIKGEKVETPSNLKPKEFGEWMLNALMFRHNDILITDLDGINQPFRNLISIENVVALRSYRSEIQEIAYTATAPIKDELGNVSNVDGFVYMNDKVYAFYDKDRVLRFETPHDLGECPADYISPEPFADDDIVRKSMFSFVAPDLEEYTFLKTLQRMTDPNGAIPVTAILSFPNKDGNHDVDTNDNEKQPPMPMSVSSQQAEQQREVTGQASEMQTGTIIPVKARLMDTGAIDVNAVKNYIQQFHKPVDSMEYLNDRINELQNDIIQSVAGDFKEQNESAQNERQVNKGYITKEDSLRRNSKALSRIRKRSDFKMLALQYGKDVVSNEAFYGSRFFPESQDELFDLFDKANNPIERKQVLLRISKNENRFDPDEVMRKEIMYHLMPYVSDKDFETAVTAKRVSPINFEYQTRFNYWIDLFQAQYGDILQFYHGLGEASQGERITLINNLISNLITDSGIIVPDEQTQIS